MRMSKKLMYFLASGILLIGSIIVAFQLSKSNSIMEYVGQHTMDITMIGNQNNKGYLIPTTNLRWKINSISILDNIHKAGWDMSAFENIDDNLSENGDLKGETLLLTVSITVSAQENSLKEYDAWDYSFNPKFLKLGNLENVYSFLNSYPIIAISPELKEGSNSAILPPGEEVTYKIAYFLNEDVTPKNGCLFTNISPPQLAEVCIPLEYVVDDLR